MVADRLSTALLAACWVDLLDVLLSIKMPAIVDILNIPVEMSQALVMRDGRLGEVLKLIEAKEKGDFAIVQEILRAYSEIQRSDMRCQVRIPV